MSATAVKPIAGEEAIAGRLLSNVEQIAR